MRVVAKFGGTSLGSGDRINRAADSIAAAVEDGHEIAVVASAMGSTTDELLDEITFETDEADRAQIVSMGERTSVRMLKAALSARGIDSVFLEPGSDEWPVITDEYGEVNVEETQRRGQELAEKLDGTVPVLTGFLAEGPDGSITTLGRGGSDTSAVMLGKYMDADEVVIVTDVEGVMTGDPTSSKGLATSARSRSTNSGTSRFAGPRSSRPPRFPTRTGPSTCASSTISTATCCRAGRASKASSGTWSTSASARWPV